MVKPSKKVCFTVISLFVLLSPAIFLRSAFADTPVVKVPEAQKQYTNGVHALGRNDLIAAETDFKASLALDPKNVGVLVALAEVSMREHKPQAAEGYLKQSLTLAPNDARVRSAWGGYLYDKKDLPGAIAALKQATVLDPSFLNPHLTLADIYLVQQKKPNLAADEYRAALKIDPKNYGATYALGESLKELGDFDGAIAQFQAASRLQPKTALPLDAIGKIYVDHKQYDKAAATYEQAIKVQPAFYPARVALGDMYAGAGNDVKALEEYHDALKIDPKLAVAYTRIGIVYDHESKPADAISAYQSAISYDTHQADAYNNMAWDEAAQKTKLDEAVGWATKAVALEPQNPGYLDTLGWVLHIHGESAKAVAPLTKASTLSPKDPEILYHLGVVYQESGKAALAAESFNKALNLNPKFDGAADAKSRLQTPPTK